MKNTGQILRNKNTGKSRYTPISNDILQSVILTPEEKSILVHLLSLPEDWIVYKTHIWKKMNMGRDKFNKHWKTLVEKGYIESIKIFERNTNLIKGWNHIVFEEPINRIPDTLNLSKSETQGVNKVINEQSNNLQNNKLKNNNLSTNIEVLGEILDETPIIQFLEKNNIK